MKLKFTKTFIRNLSKDVRKELSKLTEDDVASLIQRANWQYYNSGEPLLSDDVFDEVKDHLERLHPGHSILHSVGCAPASKMVRLPYYMGSLDKIKGDVSKFAERYATAAGGFVVSDKLDGVSALITIKDCKVRMFTRGDGYVGQDVSHLMSFIKHVPDMSVMNKMKTESVAIRGELICSIADFEKLQQFKPISNAQSMVSGIVNSKIPDLQIASMIQFVAHEMIHPQMKPTDQLQQISDLGFSCVRHTSLAGLDRSVLTNMLADRRKSSDFMMDGLVVSHDQTHTHPKEGNPDYAFAFKSISLMSKAEVKVDKVEWNMTKDGYLVPTLIFPAVTIKGVSISRTHGFNARYINDNLIGPGSMLLIRRSGDVIPYVEAILSASTSGRPQLPDVGFIWDKTGVNVIASDVEEGVMEMKNLQNFFAKVDVPGLGPGNVKKIYEAGYKTVGAVLNMTEEDFMKVPSFKEKMSSKLRESIINKKDAIDCVTMVVASNTIGRGVGATKIKMILDRFPNIITEEYVPSIQELVQLDGIQKTTADLIVSNLPKYFRFSRDNSLACEDKKNTVVASNVNLEGEVVLFTGFRSKALESFIQEHGGEVKTSMSRKVTLLIRKDDEISTKFEQAKEWGIKVMNLSLFEKEYKV